MQAILPDDVVFLMIHFRHILARAHFFHVLSSPLHLVILPLTYIVEDFCALIQKLDEKLRKIF
jgi:hypothetical protein